MRFIVLSLIDLTLCIDSLEDPEQLLFCSLNLTTILMAADFCVNNYFHFFHEKISRIVFTIFPFRV